MSSSFSINLYNTTNPYSSDIYYYYEEINYKVPRYNACAEDLRSNFYYRNESNKFYLKSSFFGVIKMRIQPNIMWRENILYVRTLLSNGLLEV